MHNTKRPAPWLMPAYRNEIARTCPVTQEACYELRRPIPATLCAIIWPDLATHSGHGQELAVSSAARPYPGLRNLHNTCFVNAVCQVFLRIAPLRAAVRGHRSRCPTRDALTCGACSLARQADLLEGQGTLECPVAVATRHGVFGREFRAPHTSACTCALCNPGIADVEVQPQINFLEGSQCDAYLFCLSIIRCMGMACESDHPSDRRQLNFTYGVRDGIEEAVLGSLVRERSFCRQCKASHDRMLFQGVWNLQMPTRNHRGLITLDTLFTRHFLPERAADGSQRCPQGLGCIGAAMKQKFLERDPPVLCMALMRGSQLHHGDGTVRNWKDKRPVWFSRTLNFMRSGFYEFLGAVLHLGDSADDGHYIAISRVSANEFMLFDDARVQRYTWEQIQHSESFARSAYILVYTRGSLRDPAHPTGAEDTPYARPILLDSADHESEPTASGVDMDDSPDIVLPLASSSGDTARTASAEQKRPRGSPGATTAASSVSSPKVASPPTKCARRDGSIGTLPNVPAFPQPSNELSSSSTHTGPVSSCKQSTGPWTPFTPTYIDPQKCLGRTWNRGTGGQCTAARPAHADVCARCARNLAHGRVDGPIPAGKLREFEKKSIRAVPKSTTASASSSAVPKS